MSVTVEISRTDPRWTDDFDRLAERAATATLAGVGLDPSDFEVSVLACDDARIADLNAAFRQKGTATNVLSWPSDERGAEEDGDMPDLPAGPMDAELGDIAISYDTCRREAAQEGKVFEEHVTHLIVHGTLHLLGFDHIRDGDAALMERLEIEILGNMDIQDPYS